MKVRKLQFIRNIGIAAHIDAGKTTLTERILFFTGKSHRIGETHLGNSQMDTMKQEIEKGITISSAATQASWEYLGKPITMNIIDTPGHVDFTIEVERCLRVLDGAVALFDAVDGVESQTETVWQQAQRYEVPAIGFVNKMDKPGADFSNVVRHIRERLGANAVGLQLPIFTDNEFVGVVDLLTNEALYWSEEGVVEVREIPANLLDTVAEARNEMMEMLAEFDDQLLAAYFDHPEQVTQQLLSTVIRRLVLSRKIVPVLMGAAYKNKGIQPLLDAVAAYLPSPADRKEVTGTNPDTDATETRKADPEGPVSALVFKIALDEQNRKLCFFRVYSGTLKAGDTILNTRTGKTERIGRLYQMHANKRTEISEVMAGEIAATVGLKTFRTGDTLSDVTHPVELENLFIPKPVISMAIEPKRNDQLAKLGELLGRLRMEDPSFTVKVDHETGQTILLGMGELHLEVMRSRIENDFGIEITTGAPQVAYQEAFTETVRHRERLKKQGGGPGLFAEIEVILGPADAEFLENIPEDDTTEKLQFVNQIVGGSIPKEFIPSVEAGFRKMMQQGPIAGYPVSNLKVVLVDGSTHSNDSKPLAFELCAMDALRAATGQLKPELLEPVMRVEVSTPEEYVGAVIGGLNRRRAVIQLQEKVASRVQVVATVPLAEMFGYVNQLRGVSAGMASYSMKMEGYAPAPASVKAAVTG